MENVSCGVPQGSVLGPVLFIIYVNDLGSTVPVGGLVVFADDTRILKSYKNLEVVQKKDVGLTADTFKSNRFCLNLEKSDV